MYAKNRKLSGEDQIKKLISSRNIAIRNNFMTEEIKPDPKYKTELCKKFEQTGYCPYGHKCRFAHGKKELIAKNQGTNYKKKSCKSFSEKGFCLYGSRCNFKHWEKNFEQLNFSFYYLQLFLFKYSHNFSLDNKINNSHFLFSSSLIHSRLPVFESDMFKSSNSYTNINKSNQKEFGFTSEEKNTIMINTHNHLERSSSTNSFSNEENTDKKSENISEENNHDYFDFEEDFY